MKNINVVTDIPYGSYERQKFDLFVPEIVKCDSGIILFVHGGGWSEGDKSGHHEDCRFFSELGYVCAAMNYRFVADEITVFDELDDISSALKIIKQKCSEYDLHIGKLILSGGSAGGHLSLLYSYTRKNEAPVTPVAACVYCPPVDCSKQDFLLGISGEFEDWKYGILSKCCGVKITKESFLDDEQQKALKKISPFEYVSEKCVPTAVFHGKSDELVPLKHINKFLQMLDEKGVKNSLLIYENSGHSMKDDPETAAQAKVVINEYAKMYF